MSFYGGRPGKRGTKWFFNIDINESLDETIYNEGDINLSSKGQIYIAGYNDGKLEFIDTGANITGSQGLQGDSISSIELVTDPADNDYMNLKVTLSKLQNGNFIKETEYIGPVGIDNIVLNDDTSLTISVGDKEYATQPLGITDIVLNDDKKTISFKNANSEYTTEPLGITDIKNNDEKNDTSLIISVGNKKYATQPLGITNIEANSENNEYKLTLKYANNGEFITGNIKGEKGNTGKGLTIKYHVNKSEDLSTEVQNPELGDVASVGKNKEIYIYVNSNEGNTWINHGQLGSISVKEGTDTPETLSPDSFYLKTDTNELFIGLDNSTPFKVSSSDKMDKENPIGTGSFTFNGKELISSNNNITENTHLTTKDYVDTQISKIDVSSLITGKMDKENPSGTGSFSLNRKAGSLIGDHSFAEGYSTEASGEASHAEGRRTIASGTNSHAEGYFTKASGFSSHAEGINTKASGQASHVQGKYNIEDNEDIYAHIVGNGSSDYSRSNAHTLGWDGNAWFAGDVYVGSTSGTNKDDDSKKLATQDYVDTQISNVSIDTSKIELITEEELKTIFGTEIISAYDEGVGF